jgi:hypothetical protein
VAHPAGLLDSILWAKAQIFVDVLTNVVGVEMGAAQLLSQHSC